MKKDSFEKKLAAYLTLSAAYLAGHPVEANAQILYSNVNPDTLIHNNTSYFLDLNNDGIVDFKLQKSFGTNQINNYYTYWMSSIWSSAKIEGLNSQKQVMWANALTICEDGGPIPLIFGSHINDASLNGFSFGGVLRYFKSSAQWQYPMGYADYFNTFIGCFNSPGDSYIGLKIITGTNNYFGWARINFDNGFVLKDYAINLTPNTQITAGYIPTCAKPVNLNSVSINNHSQKLQWTIQGTSIGYKVRVRKTGTTVWSNLVVNGNLGFKQIYGLTPNTNYEWQVRSICQQTPLVQSNFTTLQTFTTPLRLEDDSENDVLNETQNELFIYPNPATNELYLLTDEAGDYEMKIINMLGQIVVSEKINLQQEQSIIVNISNLPAGTYQAIVSGNNGNQIGRFVKE